MDNIQLFQNDEFGTIRMIMLDDSPWFVASDVCKILGHSNPTVAMNNLEDCEKAKLNLGLQGGSLNIISESGFYTLVLRSRKPVAKPFRLWVTQEVLPQIRRTGGYIPTTAIDTDEMIMAKAIQIAAKTIKEKDTIISTQENRIKDLEETEKDWKLLMNADGSLSVNEMAHMIGVGEYTLFSFLRNIGVLFRNKNGDNVPYEKPINKDKFTVVSAIAPNNVIHSQTRILPKGIPYITNLLRKHGYLEGAI